MRPAVGANARAATALRACSTHVAGAAQLAFSIRSATPGAAVIKLCWSPAAAAARRAATVCSCAAAGTRSATASARRISTTTCWRGVTGVSERSVFSASTEAQFASCDRARATCFQSPGGIRSAACRAPTRSPRAAHRAERVAFIATHDERPERPVGPNVQRAVEYVRGFVESSLVEVDEGELDLGHRPQCEVRGDIDRRGDGRSRRTASSPSPSFVPRSPGRAARPRWKTCCGGLVRRPPTRCATSSRRR